MTPAPNPIGSRMAKLEEVCEEYLADRPFQLWADWTINNPDSRKEAAAWLAEQIRSVGERVVTVHGGALDTD